MTFAQLMELAQTTAASVVTLVETTRESVETTRASVADTTVNVNALVASIANLVERNKANEASILALDNQIGDIDRSVGTTIICLENAIGANESAIECFELEIPPPTCFLGKSTQWWMQSVKTLTNMLLRLRC